MRIVESSRTLAIAIPLALPTDKVRIKKRSCFSEYGEPVAARQKPFSQLNYVEWQIGYDVDVKDNKKMKYTTLPDERYTGANGKTKALYELSEYIYYFYRWGIIEKGTLLALKDFLQNLKTEDFVDYPANFAIDRSQPVPKQFLGLDFFYAQVKYPLLVHKFSSYEVLVEIIIKENQKAVGVQPMLYLCFPITELVPKKPLLGRPAEKREKADFIISRANIDIFIHMIRIFGILSAAHNKDVLAILEKVMMSAE
jgi:hypothetical protein